MKYLEAVEITQDYPEPPIGTHILVVAPQWGDSCFKRNNNGWWSLPGDSSNVNWWFLLAHYLDRRTCFILGPEHPYVDTDARL